MKKTVFFVFALFFGLALFAQPKISFESVINGVTNCNQESSITHVADFNGDGFSDFCFDGTGFNGSGSGKIGMCFFAPATGNINVNPIKYLNYNGIMISYDVLKIGTSLSYSIQAVTRGGMTDTLFTYKNYGDGSQFAEFKKILPHQVNFLRSGNAMNQYPGDETFAVDLLRNDIFVYHFGVGDSLSLLQTINLPEKVSCLEFADFNGDLIDDLVVICALNNNSYAKAKIYCQNSEGILSFWREINLPKRKIYSARIADLQNDNFPDIVVSSNDDVSGGILIANFGDTSLVPSFITVGNFPLEDFSIGDFNRDHYLDIIAIIHNEDSLAVFRNYQDGTFVSDQKRFTGDKYQTKYRSSSVIDYSGDGKLDFIFALTSQSSGCPNSLGFMSGFKGIRNAVSLAPDLQVKFNSLPELSVGENLQKTFKVQLDNLGEAAANSILTETILEFFDSSNQLIWQKSLSQNLNVLAAGDSVEFSFIFDSIEIINNGHLKISARTSNLSEELTMKNNFVEKTFGNFIGLPKNPEKSFVFSAYPNPSSGIINLIIPKAGETVEVFDALGRIIWSQKVSEQTSIDLGDYPSGIYYLKINNLTKKIIKK